MLSSYRNEEGQVVPKTESTKRSKNAPFVTETTIALEPNEQFYENVRKLIRVLSYYKYPIVVGPGDGDSWRIEDSGVWNTAVQRVVQMLNNAGILVLNPTDYIRSHARRDDWHPADTDDKRCSSLR